MSADRAGRELLSHVRYDPDWEYAAPAALAMHPLRDQVLKDLIRNVTSGDLLPASRTAVDDRWEIRKFLARVAQESSETAWSPDAADLIGRARLDLATSRQHDLRLILGANDWPTSNRLVLDTLLGLLAGRADPWTAGALAGAVAGLDPTAEDRARAREALLGLLAGQADPWTARALAGAVAELAVTAEDRARAREALLGLLAGQADPWRRWNWRARSPGWTRRRRTGRGPGRRCSACSPGRPIPWRRWN